MVMQSEQINELATALAKAQGELENANKNSLNPHYKNRYADLAEVLNTVRPVLARHGLSVVQTIAYQDGLVSVTTILMHSSGQYLGDTASAPVPRLDPQGVGVATTYLRRYSLAAFTGVAQEDLDGEIQQKPAKPEKPQPPSNESIAAAAAKLQACTTLVELRDAFGSLPAPIREAVTSVKDEMKEQLK